MKLFKLKATDTQVVFGTQEEPLSPPLWLFAQANDSSAFYYIAEDSYTNENLTEVDVDTLDRETIYTTYDGSQNQMPCSNISFRSSVGVFLELSISYHLYF